LPGSDQILVELLQARVEILHLKIHEGHITATEPANFISVADMVHWLAEATKQASPETVQWCTYKVKFSPSVK
jgi:hypothetical protein